MRDISMERVNNTRQDMLGIVKSSELTHEQKVANMANAADSLLEVPKIPEAYPIWSLRNACQVHFPPPIFHGNLP